MVALRIRSSPAGMSISICRGGLKANSRHHTSRGYSSRRASSTKVVFGAARWGTQASACWPLVTSTSEPRGIASSSDASAGMTVRTPGASDRKPLGTWARADEPQAAAVIASHAAAAQPLSNCMVMP